MDELMSELSVSCFSPVLKAYFILCCFFLTWCPRRLVLYTVFHESSVVCPTPSQGNCHYVQTTSQLAKTPSLRWLIVRINPDVPIFVPIIAPAPRVCLLSKLL